MLRHFLLGVGISLILIFCILILFNLELVNFAELDNQFILEQVMERELETGFIEEARRDFEAEITEEYIIEEAKELGMRFDAEPLFFAEYSFSPELFENLIEFELNNNSELIDNQYEENSEEAESEESEIITLTIQSGIQAREVAWLLEEKGLIDNTTAFILLINRFNMEDKIMAGTYYFPADISLIELLLEITVTI